MHHHAESDASAPKRGVSSPGRADQPVLNIKAANCPVAATGRVAAKIDIGELQLRSSSAIFFI
jgi:hypothetical protein